MKNKDFIQLVKETFPLLDEVERSGYTLTHAGSYYSTKEHDSIRIDPDKNTYWRNSTGDPRHKDVINWVQEFGNCNDTHEALSYFRYQMPGQKLYQAHTNYHKQIERKQKAALPKKKKEFQLPEQSPNYRRLYAYLTKTRKIEKEIVDFLVKKKLVYQGEVETNSGKKISNAVFVGYDYDSKAKYGEIKGITTDSTFRGTVPSSKNALGFFVAGKNAGSLFVSESVIDTMSLMSFCKENKSFGLDFKAISFFAYCGQNPDGLQYHMSQPQNEQIKRIYLCFDNDEAGRDFEQAAFKQLKKCGYKGEIFIKRPTAPHKDFNDQWKAHKEQKPFDFKQQVERQSPKVVKEITLTQKI